MNPIWELVAGAVRPITELFDELHTSGEEKIKARTALVEIQARLTHQMMDYEARLLEAQSKVVIAEAQGKSWIQRSWRPITMLTFLGLVVADTFGWTAFRLAEQAWTLLQLGLGGYVVGRSAEKIAPQVVKAMGK